MKGKIAIVTGATGGIGKEIARGLAKAGATTIIGARNLEKGEQTKKELEGDLHVMKVDVADQSSIRAFAQEFGKKFDRLDVLVNNAGAWFTDRRESPEGRELTFATNVIGPYLLTKELRDSLRAGAPSRVVNIVSAFASNYDANDLDYKTRKFDGFKAYGQSKLALRMVTWAQSKELEADRIAVNAAAPGFVRSDFNQNATGFMAMMINLSARLFAVSPAKGAETPLWVATGADLEGVTGKFFDGHKEKESNYREPEPIAVLIKALEKASTAPSKAA